MGEYWTTALDKVSCVLWKEARSVDRDSSTSILHDGRELVEDGNDIFYSDDGLYDTTDVDNGINLLGNDHDDVE